MFKYLLILLLLITAGSLSAQIKDFELGSSSRSLNNQSGYFDLSKPDAINFEINIWGFVRYPGKYLVPQSTSVIDLISYAGGPTEDAELDDLRLYRVNEKGANVMLKFDYNDLLWESDLENSVKDNPTLKPGDVLGVTGSERYYTMDYLNMTLGILGSVISIAILVLTINN